MQVPIEQVKAMCVYYKCYNEAIKVFITSIYGSRVELNNFLMNHHSFL